MKPRSVLIVEDEAIVAEDLRQTLADGGYDAFAIADSADQAIQHAAVRCPDVVLMDIRIRGRRDGIETAGILRERFGVPIIFLTAHADDATLARAQQVHPHGYLNKPVRYAELRSAIEIAVVRSEIERRLRESERWFSTTLHSIADAVITVDLAGVVTFVNPAAEHLIGLGRAELIGRPARDVLHLLDPDRNEVASPLVQVLAERQTVTHDDRGVRNLTTGLISAVDDRSAPVIDAERMLGAVMVFRDVTEQQRLRQQLELADRLASLGTMAAGVAHEVNNPLAAVVANSAFVSGCLERLLAAAATEATTPATIDLLDQARQALVDVALGGQRIASIVASLRVFSRPAPATPGRASVNAAIEWAIRTTASELKPRARLVTRLQPVPEVDGDEGRLGQVLVNLLLNAAQAIEPGRVEDHRIEIRVESRAGEVVVDVEDTGPGIAADVRGRIFEPFFTTKAVGVGAGLGLSICHGMVTAMGGALECDSTVGRGTTMRVRLRAAAAAPPPAMVEVVAAPATRRARVLAIDDEPMILRAITRMLQGHDVVAVSRAEDALALLDRHETFDVIVSDLMMPTMTGIELYEALLARDADLAREVIFITGGALTTSAAAFLETITNVWLQKPFAPAALQALVVARLTGRPRPR